MWDKLEFEPETQEKIELPTLIVEDRGVELPSGDILGFR